MKRFHTSVAAIAAATLCAGLGSTAAARQAAEQVTVAFSDRRPGR
jgi:ABC-type glycerol-3-phosphate transport system substrate-binding protein